MTAAEALLAAVLVLPVVAPAVMPWFVLRRERALWRTREVMRKNPHFDSVYRVMESLKKLGITAEEGSKGMSRMSRALRPLRK